MTRATICFGVTAIDEHFCGADVPNANRKIPLAGRDPLMSPLIATDKSSNEKRLQLALVFGTGIAYASGEHCRSLV
jgi:hypothetical protein